MRNASRFVIILTLLVILMPGYAQNLVQNPSFESPVAWDDLWFLSMDAPSTVTAVATKITSDAHEGTTSVELSNTNDKEWTYFYTDSVNAPISFIANQSYEVKGWVKSVEKGKKVELSLVWNNKQDEVVFYNDNPDPVNNPDWFLVEDSFTATADFNDGFLSLGFQNDKDGGLPAGKLLLDDFSVKRLPSTFTEIIDFSIPEQTGPALIDNLLQTVVVEVPYGTELTTLVPMVDLSLGATINPESGVAVDFTGPVIYRVTAEDTVTTMDWRVTVTTAPPSKETDIISFDFAEQTGPPTIDNILHNVITEVAYGTDVTALVPAITVSPGATIIPNSGFAVDFSTPVIYMIVAEDGITVQNYIVAAMVSTISNETDIVSFTLPEQAGPATIDDQSHTITIEVPYGTDVTALVPSIGISARASIDPVGGVATDFSSPVTYTVAAEDGVAIQDWTTEVIVLLNADTDIEDFTIAEQTGPASIDKLLHTISLEVPYGTDVTALVPTIVLPAGASINPVSGMVGDYSIPIVYTVTAEDGSTIQDWTTYVNVLPNTEADIQDFTLAEQTGPATIDKLLHMVSIDVPYGTDVTALVPTIELSAGASINPASGVSEDFSSPVVYTVTAEDGTSSQDWTTSVNVLPNTETDIEDFLLLEQTSPATIDTLLNIVSIDVPVGTDVSALIPNIQISEGASINPDSGVSVDFSAPVVFTVIAADDTTTQEWTVTVVIPFNIETDVIDFTLAEQTGPATISDLLHTVYIDVLYGTDVTALVPSIVLSSGASIDPVSGVAVDFSAPVVYTVTAADGTTTQDWMVNVLVALNNETDILSFTLDEQTGPATIDSLLHTVSINVPYGTDVTAMVPTIELSDGASINPARGSSTDFSSTVVYSVSAEDGTSTQDWNVTVLVARNTETEIVTFTLNEQTGPATIDSLLHTVVIEVAKETDVTALVPSIVLSDGASINPASDVSSDFSSAVVFTVTAEDGVSTQDWSVSVTVDPAVSVEAASVLKSIQVYPNPAREILFVELPSKGDICMQDIMGREVHAIIGAPAKTTIPVSDLDRGTYFIRVMWDDTQHVSKIILE